jgi:hypothetical protein
MITMFTSETTQRIVGFLRSIGIDVRAGDIESETFLPGVQVEHGTLLVDESRLAYPSDLLHEAGHLAVVMPQRRSELHMHVGDDPAEEMMAIAWSYAAAVAIGLDARVLFHDGGYKGGGQSLAENFQSGRTVGVPMLAWIGLTAQEQRALELGVPPYPHMIRWLRE